MEKSVKYVLAGVVICLGIVLSSCGKDDNEIIPGGIVNVDGEWKCRMNGEPYDMNGEPQKTFVVGGLCFFQDGR